MQITSRITIDLQRRTTPKVDAVQSDALARAVTVALYDNGVAWVPPAGTRVSLAFRKPDKKAGWYDTLPNGEPACSVEGNEATVILAPEVLTVAGMVSASVVFQDQNLAQLATFPFSIWAEKNPAAGEVLSNEYYNYSTMEEVNEAVDAALAELEAAKQGFLAKAEEALDVVHDAATEDAPAIVCEASGEIIEVADASNRPLQGLTLYGKTTQLTTTGKNLFSGGDQSFTETQRVYFPVPLAQGTYTIGAVITSSDTDSTASTAVFADDAGNTIATARMNRDKRNTQTVVLDRECAFVRFCASSTVTDSSGDTSKWSNIMVELGSTASAYEPYTGGKASPNPEYPQALENIGTSGNIGVTVMGKNIFGGEALADVFVEKSKGTKNTEAGTVSFGAGQVGSDIIFNGFKPNTRYTIIMYGNNSRTDSSVLNLSLSYTDGTKADTIRFDTIGENSYMVLTTAANKTAKNLYGTNYGGIVTLYYDKCGIFEGVLTEADFVPYESQTLSVSTPNGLPGIPVSSGGNYTDESGQQWVCDEIDFAKGVYVQRVASIVFDGTETFYMYSTGVFYAEVDEAAVSGSYVSLCSHYPYNNAGNLAGLTGHRFKKSDRTATLYFADTEIATLEDFINFVTSETLEGNPLTVLYQLAGHIETPLSAEELAAFKAIHSHKQNTTAFNDSGVHMALEYNADTKAYIDNKFAAISAALLNA